MAILKRSTVRQARIAAVGPVKVLASYGVGILKNAISKNKTKTAMHGEISRTGEGEVDLAAEIGKHPNALWIRVKAIEADNENDNGDYFSRDEIAKAYKTFEGVPVFTNHENQKVENAKGKVVLAEWDDDEGAVYCTMFIDREANPSLCRAIEEGYVTDVSMGTQVDYSICSICGNQSHTADNYCSHVKTMKGRMIEGKKVYEENYGLKFIELSVVTDGACKDCTIREVLDPDEYLAATQELAVAAKAYREIKTADMTKNSGQQEIELLNSAMDNIESVLRAMLDQRQYIDLEFMQDLTEVFADLQHVTDELVDQGYGSLGEQPAEQGLPPIPETGKEQGPALPNETTTAPGTSGVGTITAPPASASTGDANVKVSNNDKLRNRLKDLREKIQKTYEEINRGDHQVSKAEKYQKTIEKLAAVWENPSVKNFKTEVSEGDYKIVVGKDEILGMRGTQKLASLKVSSLDEDIQEALREDVRKTASTMLDGLKSRYASMEKVAEAATADTEKQWGETMEAQLRREELELHPRQDEPRQSITEDQLREKSWPGYDSSPHTQDREKGNRHEITEKQLGHGSSSTAYEGYEHHKPQFDPRDETMEAQLRNTNWKWNITPGTSDISWAAGVDDQKQQITEGQLQDWLAADDGHNPLHHITEKQLRQDQDDPLAVRVASMIASEAMKRAKEAVRRTAKLTGATPDEIIEAVAELGRDFDDEIKKYASDDLKEARKKGLKRASFHGSPLFDSSDVREVLVQNIADQKISAKVASDALEAITELENAEDEIAEVIRAEAECKGCDVKVLSSKDLLKEVLSAKEASTESEAEAETEEVKVVITDPAEIKADASDKEAFAKAAFDVAEKYAAAEGVTATERVHVSALDNGKVEVTLRGTKTASSDEKMTKEAGCDCGHEGCPDSCPDDCPCKKEASASGKEQKTAKKDLSERSEARRKAVEAQFGGEGFGAPGMGAPASPTGDVAGGGGTTMPATPPGDMSAAPGVGALSDEPASDDAVDDNPESAPPGSYCPSCGSDDVDLKGGELSCNNCGASGDIEINIRMKTWPDTIQEKGPGAEEGEDLDLDEGIGDMEGGEGIEMPQVGLAAVFRITPEMVKLAKQKPVGSYCPHCGSGDVRLASKGKGASRGRCNKCGNGYLAEVFMDTESKELVGRVAWNDKNVEKAAKAEAEGKIRRLAAAKKNNSRLASRKDALHTALKAKGWTEKFAKAGLKEQAVMIGQLAEAGLIPKK